jgi:hypothetical protein
MKKTNKKFQKKRIDAHIKCCESSSSCWSHIITIQHDNHHLKTTHQRDFLSFRPYIKTLYFIWTICWLDHRPRSARIGHISWPMFDPDRPFYTVRRNVLFKLKSNLKWNLIKCKSIFRLRSIYPKPHPCSKLVR